MTRSECKPAQPECCVWPVDKRNIRQCSGRRASRLAPVALALLTLGACSVYPAPRVVSARALEDAPRQQPATFGRAIIADVRPLHGLYHPLGDRLALVQVRDEREWSRLAAAAPGLGPTPDFTRGIVIGLATQAGTPLNGEWPISVEDVRIYDGAGLLAGQFQGGTFLPDGTTYLEAAYVPGLSAVLIVDINGMRFCPY